MNLKEYQKFALRTAIYPNISNNWQYPLIGLAGEVGEVCNKAKKIIRDHNNQITDEQKESLVSELGDLAWYFVMLCYEWKIDPDIVLYSNVHKLQLRMDNNVISGSGDTRG